MHSACQLVHVECFVRFYSAGVETGDAVYVGIHLESEIPFTTVRINFSRSITYLLNV